MPQRRSYPKSFKAQVVQEYLQPGASIAGVALGHGINANLVRKWIPLYRDPGGKNLPAFLPLTLEPNVHTRADPTIKIDVPCGHGQLVVDWPAKDPEGCRRSGRVKSQSCYRIGGSPFNHVMYFGRRLHFSHQRNIGSSHVEILYALY